MLQSKLFTKIERSFPKDEESPNARFLERGGFAYKNSAGVYSYLPLGWRVIQKISNIVREEMDAIGGQEMLMAALHDKHYLKATGRWDVDVVFKVFSRGDKEPSFNISWTHEEIIAEIAKKYVNSYRDLPFSAYQIQTKFRHEPRAKSGLLRGREFLMKDLYSFHADEKDLYSYYDEVATAYAKVFERCGLKAYYTLASGGEFTINNTHEFQVESEVGEDTIYACDSCMYAENNEVSKLSAEGGSASGGKDSNKCPKCGGKISEKKSIEVGNIFPLGTKYSEAFDLNFLDKDGNKKLVVMGSYGIGISRLMATAVEVHHDEKGIVWPENIAPFKVHLLALGSHLPRSAKPAGRNEAGKSSADDLYADLQKKNVEVLYDDREASPGEKLVGADLIGLPFRAVISEKTGGKVEVRRRNEKDAKLIDIKEFIKILGN
ncbi:MAG TPA: aminoacyl--tRNA ligase-related protein [Candidatus Paceibacterota bacterium]|nr:aminoacyl--tRNA ligase-related protein [Candidatus Paceibacterota bacterium]